ncbi:hypothetical protein [Yoonia litorea]|uniref:Transferrin-binding protein B C-lobe/N-lobe beta barrel domain-containing protein n=1 Tax=Yoonia litorea TaxID=1123755 RepID=A0A1I6N1X0_9RHOB|nr:hypothetical protein [Yoonia litorea]SFS21887.1 hypothetical protein SAMN05444714_2997 [Yoonia litorea]
MKPRQISPILLLTTLGACGAGGASGIVAVEDVDAIGMGTAAGAAPASGLEFAKPGQDVRDLETLPVTVRMGRMQRDGSATRFFFSNETVTLPAGFYEGFYQPSSFTLDGVTHRLTNGAVTVNNTTTRHTDREYGSPTIPAARHEIAIVTNGFPDDFHEYAVFVTGFETDPAQLPGGTVNYAGRFNIDTWPSIDGGTPENNYRPFNGTLNLTVGYDDARVSGDFAGTAQIGDNVGIYAENVFGHIADTSLDGNGFEGQMVFETCLGVTSCTGSLAIGGAVYGADGSRISGLIMSDATFVREDDGVALRLLGPGVFYADRAE